MPHPDQQLPEKVTGEQPKPGQLVEQDDRIMLAVDKDQAGNPVLVEADEEGIGHYVEKVLKPKLERLSDPGTHGFEPEFPDRGDIITVEGKKHIVSGRTGGPYGALVSREATPEAINAFVEQQRRGLTQETRTREAERHNREANARWEARMRAAELPDQPVDSGRTPERPFMTDAEIEAGRQRVAQTRRVTAAQETERTERGLSEEREKLLINEVLDRGAVTLHMALPSEYSGSGIGGFSDRDDDCLRIGKSELERELENLKAIREEEGCNEVVQIKPFTQGRYEHETWKESKGLFRSQERSRLVRVGTDRPSHGEIVEGGSSEPASIVNYEAHDLPSQYVWAVPDGRIGQVARLNIVLPESVADKLAAALETDPSLMHRLVDQAATRKLRIPDAAWTAGDSATNGHHLRPPFKKWAEDAGGRSKIRIITESASGQTAATTKELAAE